MTSMQTYALKWLPFQISHRLVVSSGMVFGARLGGVVAGLGLQLALARLLGAADLGTYFLITSAGLVLAVMCSQGYPLMIPKYAAKDSAGPSSGLLQAFMRHATSSVALAMVAVCFPLVLWVSLAPSLDPTQRAYAILGLLTVPPLAALRMNGALANSLRQFSLGYVPDLLVRPSLLFSFVAVIYMFNLPFDLLTVLAAQLLIATSIAAWQYIRVAKHVPRANAVFDLGASPSGHSTRAWRIQSLKLLPALIFVSIFADIIILLTGTLLSPRELGVFGVCLKMSMIVAFTVYAIHQLCARDLADAIGHDNAAELRFVLRRANLLGTGTAMFALVASLLFGKMVLGVFGQEFSDAYWYLNLLVAAQVVRALAGPGIQVLPLLGQEAVAVQTFAFSLLILITASFVLIPAYGLGGAVASVFASTCAWAIWQTIQLYRRTGIFVAQTAR